MRNIKKISTIIVGLFIVVLVVVFSLPSRAAGVGETWQRPIIISADHETALYYGQLDKTGDAVYYQMTITTPQTLALRIDVARQANAKFAPQLVVYEPYTTTIGPLLPMDQPPQTIARVYPMTRVEEIFDLTTQVSYAVRLQAEPELAVPGTYRLAVYNAGSAGGTYRLVLGNNTMMAKWPDVWMMPIYWWHDQTFTGFSWLTLIFPVILALLLWLVYLRLDYHQLHVHKKYPKRAAKKSKS